MTSYRYPSENAILFLTLSLVAALLLLTAGLTACLAPLLILLFVWIAYNQNRAHHRELEHLGIEITPQNIPELYALLEHCRFRLKPGPVEGVVVRGRELNAYTFGLSDTKMVVLFDALFQVMDGDELTFILGHELGHVALGHTWLNTLLGSMEAVPSSFSGAFLFNMAFLWWNRACEYSADRAGLLACANVNKAISALIKIASGKFLSPEKMGQALKMIDQEDDSLGNVIAETFSTHPMIIRRINELKAYAASQEYRSLVKSL